jgi:hypothetical protein
VVGEMSILSVCSNPDILSIIRIINMAVLIIKIAVPIILIVVLSFDLLSAIKAGDEDLLKKQLQGAVRKMIAAVVIFLLPSFINLIIKIADPENIYTDCMSDATVEGIQEAYVSKASELVLKAENTNSYTDYGKAKSYITKIDDETVYNNFEERLDAVYQIIDKKMAEANKNNMISEDGTGSGGTGIEATSGTGDYKVEYKDGVFYIPNIRATSNSHIPAQSGTYGTHPEFGRRLDALLADAKAKGYNVTISNGHRTYSQQLSLWTNSTRSCSTRSSWVACPGGSRHGFGIAADLKYNGSSCSESNWNCNSSAKWVHDNAASYGLKFRLSNEPWHIEPDNVVGGSFGKCNASC